MTPNLQLAARILSSRNTPAAPTAALLRMAKAGGSYRRGQDAVDGDIRGTGGRIPTRVSGAGLFGAGATLPSNPGPPDMPIDPAILPGSDLPNDTFTGGQGGGMDAGAGRYVDAGPFGGNFGPLAGESWLGGTFDGLDPVTGRPIYNPLGYGSMSGLATATEGDRGVPFAGLNLKPPEGHGTNRYVF